MEVRYVSTSEWKRTVRRPPFTTRAPGVLYGTTSCAWHAAAAFPKLASRVLRVHGRARVRVSSIVYRVMI